ncbi:KOW domain-containing RNA-binding protein [Actinopolyspora erythraea]|uniref:hypothetical protein n=1 Tax=Actinopolyspora erythraea TaxID=414996 RepID=UPI0011858BA4|nr:hypothetical protein [Actinopolyspora erythraea]
MSEFQVGDTVKIIDYDFRGPTGTIVLIDDSDWPYIVDVKGTGYLHLMKCEIEKIGEESLAENSAEKDSSSALRDLHRALYPDEGEPGVYAWDFLIGEVEALRKGFDEAQERAEGNVFSRDKARLERDQLEISLKQFQELDRRRETLEEWYESLVTDYEDLEENYSRLAEEYAKVENERDEYLIKWKFSEMRNSVQAAFDKAFNSTIREDNNRDA